MRRIGVICAGDREIAPFLSRIDVMSVTEKAMLKFYEARLHGIEVIALYSGVCKVNAAIAAQILIDSFNVDAVINAGTAGGMAENVNLFDVAVSERVAYHDVSDDVLTEFHPWMDSVWFRSNAGLIDAAREYSRGSQYKMLFGSTVTGEQFIVDSERERINRKFAPLTVDMESAAIAHVCYANSVPFMAIRAVTDTAAHRGVENFELNCEKAAEISAEVTAGVIRMIAER